MEHVTAGIQAYTKTSRNDIIMEMQPAERAQGFHTQNADDTAVEVFLARK